MHGQSYTFTVTSTLDDAAPTHNNGYTFTIILNNVCSTTTLTAPTAPSSHTYTIGVDSAYTFTIGAWTQDPGCTHTEDNLTISPTHSWITLAPATRVVTVNTSNASDEATVTFTVTTHLSNLQTNADYTFEIVLANPCKSATLNTPTIAHMVVDDGATAT